MISGTFSQNVKFNGKIGGSRRVFEGKPELLTGGFNFDLKDLPEAGSVLPAGTPVFVDELKRTIKPLQTFAVKEVSGNTIKIVKSVGGVSTGTRVKAGDNLVILGNDLGTAGTAIAVSAVDGSHEDYDILTVNAVTGVSETTILAMAQTDGKPYCVPNALLAYDKCLAANAYEAYGEAAFFCARPVYERRMPPINDAVKKALVNAGCFFRFSQSK